MQLDYVVQSRVCVGASTSLLTRVEVLNPLGIKNIIGMYQRRGSSPAPPSCVTPVGSSS